MDPALTLGFRLIASLSCFIWSSTSPTTSLIQGLNSLHISSLVRLSAAYRSSHGQNAVLVYCKFALFHSTFNLQSVKRCGKFESNVVTITREAGLFQFEPLDQLPHGTRLDAMRLDALSFVRGVQFEVATNTKDGVPQPRLERGVDVC